MDEKERETQFEGEYGERSLMAEANLLARYRQVGVYREASKRRLPCPDVHVIANMMGTEQYLYSILEQHPELNTFSDLKRFNIEAYRRVKEDILKYREKYFYPRFF